jgi:glutathione synthase/RimK-type ligase-like ATP-grasp enzyme
MPRIAFATCAELTVLDPDDELLAEAVRALGAEVRPEVWDDGAVDWSAYDLVLVRSPWDYHLRRDAFVHWAQRVESVTRLRNAAATIAWNTDKTYLRRLAEQGVPTVPTAWVEAASPPDLSTLTAERGWTGSETIVKPSIGLGSSGLMRIAPGDPDGAGARHLAEQAASGTVMVQPFLPSLEAEGELSLVWCDGALSHVVRKRPPAGEFRVQPDFGAVTTTDTATPEQLAIAERALEIVAGEQPLYARVDLVAGPDGEVWLMELELVEPTLYLAVAPGSAERFAPAVLAAASA